MLIWSETNVWWNLAPLRTVFRIYCIYFEFPVVHKINFSNIVCVVFFFFFFFWGDTTRKKRKKCAKSWTNSDVCWPLEYLASRTHEDRFSSPRCSTQNSYLLTRLIGDRISTSLTESTSIHIVIHLTRSDDVFLFRSFLSRRK